MRRSIELRPRLPVTIGVSLVTWISGVAGTIIDIKEARVAISVSLPFVSFPKASLLRARPGVWPVSVTIVVEGSSSATVPVPTASSSTTATSIATTIRLSERRVRGRRAGGKRTVARASASPVSVDAQRRLAWISLVPHVSKVSSDGRPPTRRRPASSKAVPVAIAPIRTLSFPTAVVPVRRLSPVPELATVSVATPIPAIIPPGAAPAAAPTTAELADIATTSGAVGWPVDQGLGASRGVARERVTKDVAVVLKGCVVGARLCRGAPRSAVAVK